MHRIRVRDQRGMVTEASVVASRSGAGRYSLGTTTVQFMTADRRLVTSTIPGDGPREFSVVTITYDPRAPERVRLGAGPDRADYVIAGIAAVSGLLGLFVLVVALLGLFSRSRAVGAADGAAEPRGGEQPRRGGWTAALIPLGFAALAAAIVVFGDGEPHTSVWVSLAALLVLAAVVALVGVLGGPRRLGTWSLVLSLVAAFGPYQLAALQGEDRPDHIAVNPCEALGTAALTALAGERPGQGRLSFEHPGTRRCEWPLADGSVGLTLWANPADFDASVAHREGEGDTLVPVELTGAVAFTTESFPGAVWVRRGELAFLVAVVHDTAAEHADGARRAARDLLGFFLPDLYR